MRPTIIGFAVLWMVPCCIFNSELNAQIDREVEEKPASPTAKVADVGWIAGHWQGSAMGGEFEETWNPPFAGTMVGMFKFAKGNEVQFYELLTIVEKDNSLLLRLKHFDRNLVGWEERDKTIEFPLRELTKDSAVFDGLVFTRVDANNMKIEVTAKESNGEPKTIRFPCKRVVDTHSVE